jgi:stage V sporulation protein R
MMPRTYTLSDLGDIDEECQARARELGLIVPEVVYHYASAERIYDVASRGLPGRYPHWRFGRAYEQQKYGYDHGHGRIFELILNTDPVQAYLLEGNSIVAQTLVMAHCLGHAHVFRANRHFASTDRRILGRVRAAAQRFEAYARRYGRDEVEDFMDACQSLAFHQPLDQFVRPAPWREPLAPPSDPYRDLFPAEAAEARARFEAERDAELARFPRRPEPDLLGFIAQHAPRLEDWQRDLATVARDEAAYFAPNIRTKVLNEGFATLVHNRIVHGMQLDADQYIEFEKLNAGVIQPHAGQINPYNLGYALLREVIRVHDEPTDEDRERFGTVGMVEGWERVLEVVETYDDAALISEFLTARVCEECHLFAWEREPGEPARVTSKEADEVRAAWLAQHVNQGFPRLVIVDADGFRHGALILEHLHEGVGLDAEYAKGTLPFLAHMWGRRTVVKSVARDASGELRPVWYDCDPAVPVDVAIREQPPAA